LYGSTIAATPLQFTNKEKPPFAPTHHVRRIHLRLRECFSAPPHLDKAYKDGDEDKQDAYKDAQDVRDHDGLTHVTVPVQKQ
jgi:hypothetical protein